MEYSKVAGRLREQIGQFSGELSKGLPKVSKRLVSELVYGIQASQSVVLNKSRQGIGGEYFRSRRQRNGLHVSWGVNFGIYSSTQSTEGGGLPYTQGYAFDIRSK